VVPAVAQGSSLYRLTFITWDLGLRGTPACEDFKRDWGGLTAKNADFRPINRYISETIEDRHIVAIKY